MGCASTEAKLICKYCHLCGEGPQYGNKPEDFCEICDSMEENKMSDTPSMGPTPKPTVTCVNVTQDAAEMLILAKQTRLQMTPELITKIYNMSPEEKRKEIEYIANTIPASWEFVDFIFLIQNVTRAFTHQFVRGRHASYAQQTMRVLDVDGWTYSTGPTINDEIVLRTGAEKYPTRKEVYDETMKKIAGSYNYLVDSGAAIEDARGILPTNIQTNILVKMNLRTLVETCRKRSSARVQGEYREVIKQMKTQAFIFCPWTKFFFERTFDKAAEDLQNMITDPVYGVMPDVKTKMIKLLDQMRSGS